MAREQVLKRKRMLQISIPISVDRKIKRVQEKYEAAGMRRPSKADLCVHLIQQGFEHDDFSHLIELSPEFEFESEMDHRSRGKSVKQKVGV